MGFLFLLFTILPVAELYLLIKVGKVIGAWDTVAIVIFTGFIGAYIAKSQGFAILKSAQKQLSQGQLPSDDLVHGFMVFLGGVLLITPGFISDLVALVFILPVTRKYFLKSVKNFFLNRIQNGQFRVFTNVNGQWHDSHEQPRDVSPKNEAIKGPAKILDFDSYKANREI